MTQEDVTVVIPAWNSERWIDVCLGSVLGQVASPEAVLVVDNGSTDATCERVEALGVPCVSMARNHGFAVAVNIGATRSRSRFVFVLNVDTVVQPGAIAALVEALDADPTLAGVQPKLLQDGAGDASRIYSAGQCLAADGRASERGAGDLDGPAFDRPREIFGVCGAACLLRCELFEALGGYDERFFAFHEDVELNARARLHGWRFGYVPRACVLHAGNAVWMNVIDRPLAFNTELVARNRLATNLKVLPARSLPKVVVAEAGALLRSVPRRTFLAALRGRLAFLRWVPQLLRERRALRGGGRASHLDPWLS